MHWQCGRRHPSRCSCRKMGQAERDPFLPARTCCNVHYHARTPHPPLSEDPAAAAGRGDAGAADRCRCCRCGDGPAASEGVASVDASAASWQAPCPLNAASPNENSPPPGCCCPCCPCPCCCCPCCCGWDLGEALLGGGGAEAGPAWWPPCCCCAPPPPPSPPPPRTGCGSGGTSTGSSPSSSAVTTTWWGIRGVQGVASEDNLPWLWGSTLARAVTATSTPSSSPPSPRAAPVSCARSSPGP
jgi:hypothetical protein